MLSMSVIGLAITTQADDFDSPEAEDTEVLFGEHDEVFPLEEEIISDIGEEIDNTNDEALEIAREAIKKMAQAQIKLCQSDQNHFREHVSKHSRSGLRRGLSGHKREIAKEAERKINIIKRHIIQDMKKVDKADTIDALETEMGLINHSFKACRQTVMQAISHLSKQKQEKPITSSAKRKAKSVRDRIAKKRADLQKARADRRDSKSERGFNLWPF